MNFLEILKEVQSTKKSIKTTPHVALKHLGFAKRGWRVNEKVYKLLEDHDVMCEPTFEHVYIYGEIEISARPKASIKKSTEENEDSDPIPRLSLLKASDLTVEIDGAPNPNKLIFVNRDTTVEKAVTLMLYHDFSQLPILSGKTVEGMISWKSIGKAMSLGHPCETVNQCKEDVRVLELNVPLFDAVKTILEKEVVLVKKRDQSICGIVTITDIGEQFISMAEPFLVLEQIENHIRKILDKKFSEEELNAICNPDATRKPLEVLSDLNFGDYLKLIEGENNFKKLGLKVDRVMFLNQLDDVRQIRNDVMHFDPDIKNSELMIILRRTVKFLSNLLHP
ncbi:CBS domain-containing protein [Taibaiella chishuiensis]|uniref:CBS domain-containing protein n=1 Tax=Taibaiella chishuiensis TaxID=1434707 RepID=A0A2P8D0Q1_9BACT|nr:CBS domain-containing protein [Taibaiella chishuiensis]PSK90799.1 CBS domain-containing protein [Taibaiella chishuiensis]